MGMIQLIRMKITNKEAITGSKKKNVIGESDRQVRASTSMATKEKNEYRKQTIKDQQKRKVKYK